MAFKTKLVKLYEPTLFFSIESEERESFAYKHFPASSAGSLFQFFKKCWELLLTMTPQTKISYKLDSFLPTCLSISVQNIKYGAKRLKEGFYMKKYISQWFGSKSDKKEDPFFRKNEEGNDIFSPWGGVGETYFINDIQKQKFLKSDKAILVLATIGLIIFSVISVPMYIAIICAINLWVLINIFYLWTFTKKLKPNLDQLSILKTSSKKHVKIFLFQTFLAQTIFFIIGIVSSPQDYELIVIYIFFQVIYLILTSIFFIKEGYIFQKKPTAQ